MKSEFYIFFLHVQLTAQLLIDINRCRYKKYKVRCIQYVVVGLW